MDALNLIIAFLAAGANVAVAYAAFRAIRESQRTTRLQAEEFSKQYLQTQEENRARVRPYLRPDVYSPGESAFESRKPEFKKAAYAVAIHNVGFGPAFNVSIVLFPPAPNNPNEAPPRHYALMHLPAIAAGSRRDVTLQEGVTSIVGSMVMTPSALTLYASPEVGSVDHPVLHTQIPVLGRMAITYQDVDKVAHGAIFDYLDLDDGWQLVTYIPVIDKTLDELNAEATARLYGKQPTNLLDAPHHES